MVKVLLALIVLGSTDALRTVAPKKQKQTQNTVSNPSNNDKEDKPLCNSGAQIGEGGTWQFYAGREHEKQMDFFQLGCKDTKQQQEFFQPSTCSLPMFAKDVPERPKRFVFVGDSTVDSQAQAFAWFLDHQFPKDFKKCTYNLAKMPKIAGDKLRAAGFDEESAKATQDFIAGANKGKVKFNLHEWWGCNGNVSFILADAPPPEAAAKGFMYNVRHFYEEPLGNDDVIVMNFGAWLNTIHQKDDGKKNLQIMLEEYKSWGKDAPKLIWREITPSHWPSQDGYYTEKAFKAIGKGSQCHALTPKNLKLLQIKGSKTASRGLHARSNSLFKDAAQNAGVNIDGVKVEFLPVWQAALRRVDDHPIHPTYMKPDCTHFCHHGAVNRFMNSAILSVASGMTQRARIV